MACTLLGGNLNHRGMPRAPSKSNLAYQNGHRSCAFFRDCYYALLDYFGQQVGFFGRKVRFRSTAYALDSTLVTLCTTVYNWAHYTHAKGTVKLHMLLNFNTLLPEYVHHYTALCRPKAASHIQMAFLEPCSATEAQHVHENGPLPIDKRAVHTAA